MDYSVNKLSRVPVQWGPGLIHLNMSEGESVYNEVPVEQVWTCTVRSQLKKTCPELERGQSPVQERVPGSCTETSCLQPDTTENITFEPPLVL